jgi:hypothetical protein
MEYLRVPTSVDIAEEIVRDASAKIVALPEAHAETEQLYLRTIAEQQAAMRLVLSEVYCASHRAELLEGAVRELARRLVSAEELATSVHCINDRTLQLLQEMRCAIAIHRYALVSRKRLAEFCRVAFRRSGWQLLLLVVLFVAHAVFGCCSTPP